MSAYFVWHVCQSKFSAVRAVLCSRTTFNSNSTSSSDQTKLSDLFFFAFDEIPSAWIWHFVAIILKTLNWKFTSHANGPNTGHVWSYKKNKMRTGFLWARLFSSTCSDRVSWTFLNLHGYVWTCKNDLKTVTCGRGSFCDRENIYAISNSHGYVWTGPK